MAKGRVKLNEFTTKDRENLLDLFVNNEKTLLSIYEVLFPKPSLKYTQLKSATDNINIAGPQQYETNMTRLSGASDPNMNMSLMLDSLGNTMQVSADLH